MTDKQFSEYKRIVENYRENIRKWEEACGDKVRKNLRTVLAEQGYDYPLCRLWVFNRQWEKMDLNTDPEIIITGDNPGRKEQEKEEYLTGPSGKLARRFFSEKLNRTGFESSVLISNKCPAHTPRTHHLKEWKVYPADLIRESQVVSAEFSAALQKLFGAQLWIIGMSHLKKNGIFSAFQETLSRIYENSPEKEKILVFPHFSMNAFSRRYRISELKPENRNKKPEEILQQNGIENRRRFFFW